MSATASERSFKERHNISTRGRPWIHQDVAARHRIVAMRGSLSRHALIPQPFGIATSRDSRRTASTAA